MTFLLLQHYISRNLKLFLAGNAKYWTLVFFNCLVFNRVANLVCELIEMLEIGRKRNVIENSFERTCAFYIL